VRHIENSKHTTKFSQKKGTMQLIKLLILLITTSTFVVSQRNPEDVIFELQTSSEYRNVVDRNALSDRNSYQTRAQRNANAYMQGKTEDQIRNYYVLSCIYIATNGVSNPRTENDMPGQRIPRWTRSDQWIINPDYCRWRGVKCDRNDNVREIDLHSNNLHGSWPNEVALLGDSLELLELFDNYYLYSIEPKWMLKMSELQFLYFGTTSFEARGASPYLKGCTELRELDMSNCYWSNGPLLQEAFQPLTELYYLDIGDNKYDTSSYSLPNALRFSQSLENLYMDNVLWSPSRPTLDIITSIPLLYETWNDYTQFSGGLPTTLGRLRQLRSFSCAYCGLTGSLPSQLSNTNIDRLWLFGNRLSGRIPSSWGNLDDLKYLYLESNQLSGSAPSSLCSLSENQGGDLAELGMDCHSTIGCSCCTCCGAACGNIITGSPTSGPPSGGGGMAFCFSGDSLVTVKNKGLVTMSDLLLGDNVMVSNNKYEPVYSFGHKNPDTSVSYLQIGTVPGQSLVLSEGHMITVDGGGKVPASTIKEGDMLLTATDELAVVKYIRGVERKGAFAPFTTSGTIVVNDIVASNYIAYQSSENLHIGGIDTTLSFQWLAHTFNSMHRLMVMGGSTNETYTTDGVSVWVDIPHKLFSWVLQQNSIIVAISLIPAIAIFGISSFIETLILNTDSRLSFSLVLCLLFVVRRAVFATKKTKVL